jgi:uncharacterized paraquat-inducible protein A
MEEVDGYALDDIGERWYGHCPECDCQIEFAGYFDSGDTCECPECKTEFKIKKVWIETDYIE